MIAITGYYTGTNLKLDYHTPLNFISKGNLIFEMACYSYINIV